MRTIGNIFWFLICGLLSAISLVLIGFFICITIIGIPFGVQCFKIAGFSLYPFGRSIQYGGGAGSAVLNIIWILLAGFWLAVGYAAAGLIFCVTIVGIPFGMQCFKLSKLSLMPFGAQIVPKNGNVS